MKRKSRILSVVIFYVLLFLSLLTVTSTWWCNRTFGKVSMEQLLYTLLAPTTKTDSNIIISWLLESLIISIVAVGVIISVHFLINRSNQKKRHAQRKLIIVQKYLWIFGIVMMTGSLVLSESNFGIIDYLNKSNQKTDIYEPKKTTVKKEVIVDGNENLIYADPWNVAVTGENTNNLIYVYLESYENTFMDVANGGIKEVNCLPELTQLARDNISFSNSDKLGGAQAFTGTTWTIGSMVGQSSGLPLKVEVANNMDKYDEFMPGARMIGDILAEQGYVQEFCLGGAAGFAGTDKLFEQHGNYKIIDCNTLDASGRLLKDEYSDWGVNDKGLFRIAREEISNLANSGQKFNFTMATLDCHTPDGMRCSLCPRTYKSRYENIYACQSKQVNDFVTWCKQQDWYANTTIVLVGDHNTMAASNVKDVPSDYIRTTYNCFINSKVPAKKNKDRLFSQLDMFPTTLVSLGFNIDGNKLGLGTNLFSSLPTTIEKYGQEYIENEVQKSSSFMDENIYYSNQ